MSNYEVPNPILNSPYEEPREHWRIEQGVPAVRAAGRRPASYFYRDPRAVMDGTEGTAGIQIEMKLANRIRERVRAWRAEGYPGVSRTTDELLGWWRRDGRQHRLFFAQLEAAETIIFLAEARADFLQGIEVPRDEPGPAKREEGYTGFTRYACKMATGSGKTTVMGMIAAWSILNKMATRSDARFSDAVVIVCPNVTIRDRLRELDPEAGDASLYRTRDLVPPALMPSLRQGRVVVLNWHAFMPQSPTPDGSAARVVRAGVRQTRTETIHIGEKNTTARGKRYMTLEQYRRERAIGRLNVREEIHEGGVLTAARAETVRYVKSDHALIQSVLGRDVGGKRNILVMNDEAHHAYRIRQETPDATEELDFADEKEAEEFYKEATVWIDGLDKLHKVRGINFCMDLSATPYYLGRVGQATNHPFPWAVSDFGLIDAIESGLVKIPQLAVRDTTGAEIPGYFNIWQWIMPQLTSTERGGKRANPKPEAILKYAHHPIAMLAGLWEQTKTAWDEAGGARPPVFILVCRNTTIARVIHEWLAEDKPPVGIPPAKFADFRNNGRVHTIRVDSKVVQETENDGGAAKSDETRWMRFTLDTVGRLTWPQDELGLPIYPPGFRELAEKLERPKHPPGRDVRCIVSVGMLTEGWDCNTVTHIVGLRPFMSQLLCEQVVGRGLRRTSYEPGPDGLLTEEVAKVFGVPFEIVPFKANTQPAPPPPVERNHVRAVPAKAAHAIRFPRVEGYTQAVRNRVTVDWNAVPCLVLDPTNIPPEVEMKASLPDNQGRASLLGPGRLERVDLNPYRSGRRLQELAFDFARALTRNYLKQRGNTVPAHRLFPQLARITMRYIAEKVRAQHPAEVKDLWLSPYYGYATERLLDAVKPDTERGEAPEVSRYEEHRAAGSTADVDYYTKRPVREVVKSHLNYVVADTGAWEQQAAYILDTHPAVRSFAKNAGLGFAIPYVHNGERHDYGPDFLIRLEHPEERYLILETKGYDPLADVKLAAAERWCAAVNADQRYGCWRYAMVRSVGEVRGVVERQ